MFGLVKKIFGTRANPIGVDFGSDSLKLAQVGFADGDWKLLAAAGADVPGEVRHDPAGRMEFFIKTTRDLLAQGGFQGRSAVLALPASCIFFQHLRMPKMDDEALKKALPWEARGKLPIDPSHALLRHQVAGEVYQDQEARLEVICMAASRELVNQFLQTASRAKLDVVGMNVDPLATVDCFAQVYRRKSDAEATHLFVDIGFSGSRAFVARNGHMLFARAVPVGGEQFTRAVSTALGLAFDEAKLLRLNVCNVVPAQLPEPTRQGEGEGFAMLNAALSAAGQSPAPAPKPTPPAANTTIADTARQVEEACREPLMRLVQELELCRRYYESTFPNQPVSRLVFVGGEAKHRNLCQIVAQEMGLEAQVGDPMVRMGRGSAVTPECGMDPKQTQPGWSVAVGLSMGPAAASQRSAQAA